MDHVKYSQLTEQQQKDHFDQANNKVMSLFGAKSTNPSAIKAMAESGLDIISISYFYESSTTSLWGFMAVCEHRLGPMHISFYFFHSKFFISIIYAFIIYALQEQLEFMMLTLYFVPV